MNKIAFIVDGGLGRTVCMISAIQAYQAELGKDGEVLVVARGWLWAYKGSGLNVIPYGLPHQSDLLKDYEVVTKPEPYFEHSFRNGTGNLVESCFHSIGIDKPTKTIPFMPVIMGHTSLIRSNKPKLVFQPHGQGKTTDVRSMLAKEIAEVVVEFQDKYSIFIIGSEESFDIPNVKVLKKMPEANYIKTVLDADLVVGCDSSAIHLAASAGIPHIAYLSQTAGTPLYSTTQEIRIREGYEGCIVNPRL